MKGGDSQQKKNYNLHFSIQTHLTAHLDRLGPLAAPPGYHDQGGSSSESSFLYLTFFTIGALSVLTAGKE